MRLSPITSRSIRILIGTMTLVVFSTSNHVFAQDPGPGYYSNPDNKTYALPAQNATCTQGNPVPINTKVIIAKNRPVATKIIAYLRTVNNGVYANTDSSIYTFTFLAPAKTLRFCNLDGSLNPNVQYFLYDYSSGCSVAISKSNVSGIPVGQRFVIQYWLMGTNSGGNFYYPWGSEEFNY